MKGMALEAFVSQLAGKVPTPGGGAAAAVAASLGAASASMAAIYTTRKKDEEKGVAQGARELSEKLTTAAHECLELAQKDADAYSELQKTWKKDNGLSEEQVCEIKKNALMVPVTLVKTCATQAQSVHEFLPNCNPNIKSDAKVALHLLAGAARAAYQTVLVNNPDDALKQEMSRLLIEMDSWEKEVLPLVVPPPPTTSPSEDKVTGEQQQSSS